MKQQEIKKLLTDENIGITSNRIQLLELLAGKEEFMTIARIAELTKINKKSIYNNIKLLIEKGIVDAITFGGVSKYSLNDNLHGGYEIHIIEKGEIKHLEIDKKIFDDITAELRSSNHSDKTIRAIKIFVDVK